MLATSLIDAAILERARGGWPEPAELLRGLVPDPRDPEELLAEVRAEVRVERLERIVVLMRRCVAKRVLCFLLGDTPTLAGTQSIALSGAEAEVLAERTLRDLNVLARSAPTGLGEFIASLRTRVAPRILPGPRGT